MEGLLGDEAGGALRLEAAIYPFHLGHAEPGKEGNGVIVSVTRFGEILPPFCTFLDNF